MPRPPHLPSAPPWPLLALAFALACGPPPSIDGWGNNPTDPEMGAAGTVLRRLASADYADGIDEMVELDRPTPREVSNAVCFQDEPVPNSHAASDFLWQWGQFIDHDIDLTEAAVPAEEHPIPVPTGDPWFDPAGTGLSLIDFRRSLYEHTTGTDPGNPREQINEITAWLDASMVYGSDPDRAQALRSLDGSGRLKTSSGDLLPFNTAGFPNAGGPGPDLFLAGDVRANEQLALTAMHTLFVREHNFWADTIRAWQPGVPGERIYQLARRMVIAEIQHITVSEFLPGLLGPRPLQRYRGYRPRTDARISNEFSTAAYRIGHSMLNSQILRLDAGGVEIPEGHLPLRDAFFRPDRLAAEGGLEPILRGLAAQEAQAIDVRVVDDVRNFLFGPPGAGGLDLAALNIQRGRDHGIPGYNAMRVAMGMPPAASFADISSSPAIQARLATVYAHPDQVDCWVGGLAEDLVPGTLVGPLVATVLVEQFTALRDGDRYWYQHSLPPFARRIVEQTRLSDIIRRNTSIGPELHDDVFHVQ